MKKRLLTVFSFVVVYMVASMGANQAFAATRNVSITSTGFVPESITISVGDTVVWTNNDTTDHTATDDELTWDTDIIEPSATGSQIFNTAGTFTYSDTIDPTLAGTIIVQAAASGGTATPTPTPASKGGVTPTPVPQPVSGVTGPTLSLMIAGGLILVFGIASFKFI